MNYPKAKKSIKGMLTLESKRVVVSGFLGVSLIGTGIYPEMVNAAHSNSYSTSTNPGSYYPYPSNGSVPSNGSASNQYIIVNSATCSHVSGVVNGHLSSSPSVNLSQSNVDYIKSHANHSSHSSHSNHCSCTRWT